MPQPDDPKMEQLAERRASVTRGLRDSGRAPVLLALGVFAVVGLAVWALANWSANNVASAPDQNVEPDDTLANVADDTLGAASTAAPLDHSATSAASATTLPVPELSVAMGMVNNTMGTRMLFDNISVVAANNLRVNPNVLPTDAAVLNQLENGFFDIALVSSTVALAAWDAGAEIQIVGAGITPHAGTAVVTSTEASLDATELGSEPIQVQRIGGLADLALTLWLSESGTGDPGRIEVVSENGATPDRSQPVVVGPGCDESDPGCFAIADLFDPDTAAVPGIADVPVDVLVVRADDAPPAEVVRAIEAGFGERAFGPVDQVVIDELVALQAAAGADLQREGSPLLAS